MPSWGYGLEPCGQAANPRANEVTARLDRPALGPNGRREIDPLNKMMVEGRAVHECFQWESGRGYAASITWTGGNDLCPRRHPEGPFTSCRADSIEVEVSSIQKWTAERHHGVHQEN